MQGFTALPTSLTTLSVQVMGCPTSYACMRHCCFPEIKALCLWVVKTLSLNTSVLSCTGILTTSMLQGHRGAEELKGIPDALRILSAPTSWQSSLAQGTTIEKSCVSLHFRTLMQPFPQRGSEHLYINVQAALSLW